MDTFVLATSCEQQQVPAENSEFPPSGIGGDPPVTHPSLSASGFLRRPSAPCVLATGPHAAKEARSTPVSDPGTRFRSLSDTVLTKQTTLRPCINGVSGELSKEKPAVPTQNELFLADCPRRRYHTDTKSLKVTRLNIVRPPRNSSDPEGVSTEVPLLDATNRVIPGTAAAICQGQNAGLESTSNSDTSPASIDVKATTSILQTSPSARRQRELGASRHTFISQSYRSNASLGRAGATKVCPSAHACGRPRDSLHRESQVAFLRRSVSRSRSTDVEVSGCPHSTAIASPRESKGVASVSSASCSVQSINGSGDLEVSAGKYYEGSSTVCSNTEVFSIDGNDIIGSDVETTDSMSSCAAHPDKRSRVDDIQESVALDGDSCYRTGAAVQTNRPDAAERRSAVYVHVYDLDRSVSKFLNDFVRDIGTGAYHAGVEVFGEEYFFGHTSATQSGISTNPPRHHPVHVYRETLPMGETFMSQSEVEELLKFLGQVWTGDSYCLFTRNCLSFADQLCRCLGVGTIPAWLTSLQRGATSAAKSLYNATNALKGVGEVVGLAKAWTWMENLLDDTTFDDETVTNTEQNLAAVTSAVTGGLSEIFPPRNITYCRDFASTRLSLSHATGGSSSTCSAATYSRVSFSSSEALVDSMPCLPSIIPAVLNSSLSSTCFPGASVSVPSLRLPPSPPLFAELHGIDTHSFLSSSMDLHGRSSSSSSSSSSCTGTSTHWVGAALCTL